MGNAVDKNELIELEVLQISDYVDRDEMIPIILQDKLNSEFLKIITNGKEKEVNKFLSKNKDPPENEILVAFWITIYSQNLKISKLLIEKFEVLSQYKDQITNKTNLEKFKNDLVLFGRSFNNKVLSNAISLGEEELCLKILIFDIQLTKENLISIVKKELWKLLQMILMRNELIVLKVENKSKQENIKLSRDNGLFSKNSLVLDKINYNRLFDIVIKYNSFNNAEIIIGKILNWKIPTRENIVISLLDHDLDELAIKNSFLYSDNVSKEVLLYSIKNKNEIFIQKGLIKGFIDKSYLNDDDVLKEILILLDEGQTLLLGLKLLSVLKIYPLKIKYCQSILSALKIMFRVNGDSLSILTCHNSVFAVSLACELLDNIKKYKIALEISCDNLKQNLLNFGNIFIDKVTDEDFYKKLMSETDFMGRKPIDIICPNKQTKLLSDEKSQILFDMLWKGSEKADSLDSFENINTTHNLCWGNSKIEGKSSIFSFFDTSELKKGKKEILMQYDHRKKSTLFYFWTDFIFTLVIMLCNQLISIIFVSNSFSAPDGYTTTFDTLKIVIFIMNIALLLNGIFRLIYNSISKKKISWDYWTALEFIVNILTVLDLLIIISMSSPKSPTYIYIKNHWGRSVKYYISIVSILNWIRIIAFFICFRGSSNLIMTLVEILNESIFFLVIFLFYMLIISTVFYLIFARVDEIDYPNYGRTLSLLFDAALAVYQHPNIVGYGLDYVNRALLAFHVLCSNIILTNYLVAILSKIYQDFNIDESEKTFFSRTSMHLYSNRYSKAFEDKKYGEMILILPPLNLLMIPSLFLIPFPNLFKSYSQLISVVDQVFIVIFSALITFFYNLVLLPILYFKVLLLIFLTNKSLIEKLLNTVLWLFVGLPVILLNILRDNYVLISLGFERTTSHDFQDDFKAQYEQMLKTQIFFYLRKIIKALNFEFKKYGESKKNHYVKKEILLKIVQENDIDQIIYEKITKLENSTERPKIKLDIISKLKDLKFKPIRKRHQFDSSILLKPSKKSIKLISQPKNMEIFNNFKEILRGLLSEDIFGKAIDLKLLDSLIGGKKFGNYKIETFLMMNFNYIFMTFDQLRNEDNYSLIEHYDMVSQSRTRKVRSQVKYIDGMFTKICEENKLNVSINDSLSHSEDEMMFQLKIDEFDDDVNLNEF